MKYSQQLEEFIGERGMFDESNYGITTLAIDWGTGPYVGELLEVHKDFVIIEAALTANPDNVRLHYVPLSLFRLSAPVDD